MSKKNPNSFKNKKYPVFIFGLASAGIILIAILGWLYYNRYISQLREIDDNPVQELIRNSGLTGFKKIAVIGDFGSTKVVQRETVELIKTWDPELIVTVGDNNYIDNSQEGYDLAVGQFFHEYIYPYRGIHGKGSDINRFFPALGNHDWEVNQGEDYLEFFTLPGNERYYDFVAGPVHFFILNSNQTEPDGVSENSRQAEWLRNELSNSKSKYKIVISHHAPYSSGKTNGSTLHMRWPFKAWGADAVLSGDEHVYERLSVDGIPYFINGAGGWNSAVDEFSGQPLGESIKRYNDSGGAMLILAGDQGVLFAFINTAGEIVDIYRINK